jgi:hypothetical protein
MMANPDRISDLSKIGSKRGGIIKITLKQSVPASLAHTRGKERTIGIDRAAGVKKANLRKGSPHRAIADYGCFHFAGFQPKLHR